MSGRAWWFGLALAVTLAQPGGGALAANLFEFNFLLPGPRYEGVLPPCDAPAAMNQIAARFNQKEVTFWNSRLAIVAFEGVRETAFRPWAPNTIPRRFCSAVALVSDGFKHPLHYWIGEDTAMIGRGWSVEWCVVGLDRNWAYNPNCKMARP